MKRRSLALTFELGEEWLALTMMKIRVKY
jgi:chemotaxis signal transduction protein